MAIVIFTPVTIIPLYRVGIHQVRHVVTAIAMLPLASLIVAITRVVFSANLIFWKGSLASMIFVFPTGGEGCDAWRRINRNRRFDCDAKKRRRFDCRFSCSCRFLSEGVVCLLDTGNRCLFVGGESFFVFSCLRTPFPLSVWFAAQVHPHQRGSSQSVSSTRSVFYAENMMVF